jgi:hypothetical protein
MDSEPQKSGVRRRLDGIIITGRGKARAEAGAGHLSAPALPPCNKGRGQLPPWLRRPCFRDTDTGGSIEPMLSFFCYVTQSIASRVQFTQVL